MEHVAQEKVQERRCKVTKAEAQTNHAPREIGNLGERNVGVSRGVLVGVSQEYNTIFIYNYKNNKRN